MPLHNSYKILFLPKWYPNRKDKLNGIFIETHAKAVSEYCKTAVLYIGADDSMQEKFQSEISTDGNLKVFRIYYQNKGLSNSPFGKSIKIFRYLTAVYKGLKIIKTEFGKPNLVHVNVLTRPGIIALLLYKLYKIPYIITEHWSGYIPSDGSYKGFLKKWMTRKVINHASAITTVSKHLEVAMKAHQLNGNYYTIPNCVDLETLPPLVSERSNTAIFIGNLEDREKNVSPIIQALADLQAELPELKLIVVGDGIDRKKLELLALDLKLSDRIVFTGEIEHQKAYAHLAAASFLILNSNYETFSIVAAEALACGTPVLSTTCGGPEEFISSDFGKLIPVQNQEELKAGMKWMYVNAASFNKAKLKNFASENFNKNSIAQKFIAIYEPLISVWEAGNSREKISVPYNWLVLDVGSGDHPNERADVLLEREIEASDHRSGSTAVIPEGKKLVIGDATEMPFKDKEFDFVIASHIAEHIDEPEKFCKELQRVAKSGYLETPDAFSELIFNEAFHKWVVSSKNGVLVFTEKTKFKVLSEWFYRFYYLNEKRVNHKAMYSNNIFVITFVNLIRKSWKHLPRTYTRFHWKDKFEFKVIRKSQHG